MVRTEFRAVLCNDPYEIQLMQNLYDSAVKQLSLKFEILNNEFKVLYARNPIHHIEGRVKSVESLAAKLLNKGLPLTIEAAREHINDIAGVRVSEDQIRAGKYGLLGDIRSFINGIFKRRCAFSPQYGA